MSRGTSLRLRWPQPVQARIRFAEEMFRRARRGRRAKTVQQAIHKLISAGYTALVLLI
jgi:hypothetical protein